MLQELEPMESSCVLYVNVSRFNQFEESKIIIFTVTSLRIVMLPVHYNTRNSA